MNAGVIHTRRVAQSLRLLSRMFGNRNNNNNYQANNIIQGLVGRSNRGNSGLSTIEAIALIQAMNSGINQHVGGGQTTWQPPAANYGEERRGQSRGALASSLRQFADRQLPVPVPVPLPVPAPFPNAVIVAFVAAFLAAVAAGFPPFIAIIKAIVAALVALIAIIIVAPFPKKNSPLVKKIVIKKTVLPLIFPITVKKKEEKKEVIYKYKYIPKPEHHHKHHEHHEHEHEHEHEKYEKKHKYKYKKADFLQQTNEMDDISLIEQPPMMSPQIKPIPIPRVDTSHLKSIETLVNEQDKLQNMLDTVIQTTNDDKLMSMMTTTDQVEPET